MRLFLLTIIVFIGGFLLTLPVFAATITISKNPANDVVFGDPIEIKVIIPRAVDQYTMAIGKDTGNTARGTTLTQVDFRLADPAPNNDTGCSVTNTSKPELWTKLPTCTPRDDKTYAFVGTLNTAKLEKPQTQQRYSIMLVSPLIGTTTAEHSITDFFTVVLNTIPATSYKISKVQRKDSGEVVWDESGGGSKRINPNDEIVIFIANYQNGKTYSFSIDGESPLASTTCNGTCQGTFKIPANKSGAIYFSVSDGTGKATTHPTPIIVNASTNPLVTGVYVNPTIIPLPPGGIGGSVQLVLRPKAGVLDTYIINKATATVINPRSNKSGGSTPSNPNAADFESLMTGQGRNTTVLGDENSFVQAVIKNGGNRLKNVPDLETHLHTIYKTALQYNVNPLIVATIWGIESSFSTTIPLAFGCDPNYHKYDGFDNQLVCSVRGTLDFWLRDFEEKKAKGIFPVPYVATDTNTQETKTCYYSDAFLYSYEAYTPVCTMNDDNAQARDNFVIIYKELLGAPNSPTPTGVKN